MLTMRTDKLTVCAGHLLFADRFYSSQQMILFILYSNYIDLSKLLLFIPQVHEVYRGILFLSFPKQCLPVCQLIFSQKFLRNYSTYCPFNIFRKEVFCLALYTEDINSQTFVMI